MGRITASRTQLRPDPRCDSIIASKFINCLMWDGKKTTAQRLLYDALDYIKERIPEEESVDVFNQALENVKPQIEVRSRRVGGAAYQVLPILKLLGTGLLYMSALLLHLVQTGLSQGMG